MNRQAGMSMIELLMAVGIAGIIGSAVFGFMDRVQTHSSLSAIRAESNHSIKLYLDLMQRDLVLNTNITSSKNRLEITRPKIFTSINNADETYKVTYESICRRAPKNYAFLVNDLSKNEVKARSKCLRSINCKRGDYPAMVIRTNPIQGSARVPHYRAAPFPRVGVDSSSRVQLAGMAVCYETLNQAIKVTFESYFPLRNSKIGITSQEFNYDTNNKSDANLTVGAGVQFMK